MLCLVAAEVALRILTPGPPFPTQGERALRLREHPPSLDITRSPPESRIAGSDGLSNRAVHFATDADGFILPSQTHVSPDRTILFLGGSTTECYYVSESRRFHALVARDLGERTALRVNALNGSMSGNHSVHSLTMFLAKGVPHRPDAVVLMHNVNDLTTLLREGDYWNDNPSRSLVQAGECRRIHCHLGRGLTELASAAFPALTYRLGHLRPQDEFGSPAVDRDSAFVVGRFRQSLTTFVLTSRAWGVEPVLMTQPSRFSPRPQPTMGWWEGTAGTSYETFRSYFLAFNETTRSVADSLDVPLVDLARAVPAERQYFQDYVHYSDEGSALVARLITDRLAVLPAIIAYDDRTTENSSKEPSASPRSPSTP